MREYTTFFDSLEAFVDARIELAKLDPEPATVAAQAALKSAEDLAAFARKDLREELTNLLAEH